MKATTNKLKKFKPNRVYGFKHAQKNLNQFALETTTVTQATTTSGIM